MPKILLVEDEPNLLMAIEDTLLEEGFRVVTAGDGSQALDVLRGEPVDLVVSDVMMPGMDGFELCRQVRNHADWGSLPFVFLTALSQRNSQREGWESGGDAYIVKPFDHDELVSLIRSSLKRVQQIQKSLDPLMTQLKELDRLKDEHLAIVSHELRRPLTAIRGFAELLLMKDYDVDDSRQFVSYIHQESTGLAGMIDNLLELSAFEHGRIRMACEPVDLSRLCREVVQQAAMHETRARFRLDVCAAPPLVAGDRHWLERALSNLVQNAAKYSPQGGEIVIECQHAASGIRLAVHDQGIGMSEEDMKQLGEWFFRVKSPETKGIPGSGLGIALVKRVVAAHGGTFEVESRLGQGSRVGFLLFP